MPVALCSSAPLSVSSHQWLVIVTKTSLDPDVKFTNTPFPLDPSITLGSLAIVVAAVSQPVPVSHKPLALSEIQYRKGVPSTGKALANVW